MDALATSHVIDVGNSARIPAPAKTGRTGRIALKILKIGLGSRLIRQSHARPAWIVKDPELITIGIEGLAPKGANGESLCANS